MSPVRKREKRKYFRNLLVFEDITLAEFDLGANLVVDQYGERMSFLTSLTRWLKSTKAMPSTRGPAGGCNNIDSGRAFRE